MRALALAAALALALASSQALAHGGGTDSNGCHADGSTGARHCHGSGSTGGGVSTEAAVVLGVLAVVGIVAGFAIIANRRQAGYVVAPTLTPDGFGFVAAVAF